MKRRALHSDRLYLRDVFSIICLKSKDFENNKKIEDKLGI